MGEKFQGVLFEIDGALEFQGQAYPGAVELLEVLWKKGINSLVLFWIQ
jgi:ribonucleotide monophosphatase NagD (HAD superfamily)